MKPSKIFIKDFDYNLTHEKLPLMAIEGDISQITYPEGVDMVINMGNSLAFFSVEVVALIFQKAAACLKQNGVLLINSWMIGEIAIRNFFAPYFFVLAFKKIIVDVMSSW